MVTITVSGTVRLLDANLYTDIFENDNDAEKDDLYECIAAATPDELAPFLQQRDRLGRTALLHAAAKLDHERFARLLVQKGADHNVRGENDGTTILMKGRNTALNYFLQELDCSDIINARDNEGYTALHWANQDPEDLELLLEHGANPHIRDTFGKTPLLWVTGAGNTESAAVLLKYGASVKDVSDRGDTILMYAAEHSTEVLRYFLQEFHSPDIIMINAQDLNGWTALYRVVNMTGNPQTLELLLQYGANPNIQDRAGATPLHLSANRENVQTAAMLQKYGANLSLTDHTQRNTMHHAVCFESRTSPGNTQFMQWLLDVGAEDLMLARNKFGRTPFGEIIFFFQHPFILITIITLLTFLHIIHVRYICIFFFIKFFNHSIKYMKYGVR